MNCTKPESEAAREAVRVLGGPSKTARLLRVPMGRHQTVQSWLRTGRVPEKYCPDIEAETRALGATVYCERLRPDVAWGRIRGFAGPGAVEQGGAAHGGTVAVAASDANAGQNVAEKF